MTLTQYLIAWTLYIVAAIGCLSVWWRITRSISDTRLGSWLRMLAAVAILTPGFTSPTMNYMSPALLATAFNGLTLGPETMIQNGLLLAGAFGISSLIKLIFFRKPARRKNHKKTDHEQAQPNQRIEPKAH